MSLSLYIHYPFCANLCDYCDFYKRKFNKSAETDYFGSLEKEFALAIREIEIENRVLNTIYIGGGTPSLTDLDKLEEFLNLVKKRFQFRRNIEFSFEINPESINKEKLERLKSIGVSRPIFGIQSFDRKLLKTLNRKHKLEDSFRAVYLARAIGFDNFGVDMIFGLPRQTGKALSADLNQLRDLNPPHISYYQLTVERKTALYKKVNNGKIKIPGQELSAAMYRAIHDELKEQNYFRYEVSSFAKAGYECRHNNAYWEGGDYLGLGPSAHSFLNGRRFANESSLNKYIEQIQAGKRPLIIDSNSPGDRIIEHIMLGLRTGRGISKQRFKYRFGINLKDKINQSALDMFVQNKLAISDRNYLRLTDDGFLVADEIIARLLA